MAKIEDYIKENREAFDDAELPNGHSERFEALLDKQAGSQEKIEIHKPVRKKMLIAVLSVAASLAILISVGLKYIPSTEILPVIDVQEEEQKSELLSTNDYYKQQMDAQIADIMCKLSYVDPENQQQLTHDLSLMLDNNGQFVKDVENMDDEELALYYLVKHYRTNIEVLEGINQKLGKYTNC